MRTIPIITLETVDLYPQKNYMIDTFIFIRLLNPISHRKFSRIFVFSQKIEIYSDSIQAKSTFVVTKW